MALMMKFCAKLLHLHKKNTAKYTIAYFRYITGCLKSVFQFTVNLEIFVRILYWQMELKRQILPR